MTSSHRSNDWPRMHMKLGRRHIVQWVGVLQLVWMTAACTEMFYSDAQNAGRKSAQARQDALRSMKVSSAQADKAQPVVGNALVALLSGNTHVEAFRKRADDSKPYLTTYDYYAPDGIFIGRDTHSRRTVEYQDVGRWKVEADTLCVDLPAWKADPRCYTIRLAPDGAIQYWIRQPGDPFDGLLTRNVRVVRRGLQTPEYTSDPAAFR